MAVALVFVVHGSLLGLGLALPRLVREDLRLRFRLVLNIGIS